ncbi:MAG: tannase/feruloyl esterase family alpha/beta hydrolase [Sphingomonas sp.]
MRIITVAFAALGAMLATSAQAAPAGQGGADACAVLQRVSLPGLKITAATRVAPAPPGTVRTDRGMLAAGLPAYCKVEGIINERTGFQGKPYGIRFALALPDAWSGRFLLQGGGGLNGSVGLPIGAGAAGDRPALARGFAVVSHDSGHQGAVFDNAFMADQRANLDFAETAVRVVTETAKALTAGYYGKPIARSYMAGCSTGGREAMLAAQRYPELFDGIVAGAPAMRTGHSNLGTAWAAVQFNRAAPRDAQGLPIVDRIFSASDRKLFLDGLLGQCDALDGLKDGVVANVAACRFRPALLECKGRKADGCFSAAQVRAIEAAYQPPKDASGRPLYAPFPYDTGNIADGPGIPGFFPTGKPGVFGPASRDLTLDTDARIAAIRADAGQRLTDTDVWTNLNGFTAHGGKILFYHGVSDPWFSALDTLDYWQRAAQANGAVWADTSRFYMVPGMGHCGGGANSFDSFDLLGAVVEWVEQGKAPEAVTATRSLPMPGERPLCPWPSYPHYIGGDDRAAASFRCRTPA